MTFQDYLEFGKEAEMLVSNLLQQRGCFLLDGYQYSAGDKAPTLNSAGKKIKMPDLLVFNPKKQGSAPRWIEVKHRSSLWFNRFAKKAEDRQELAIATNLVNDYIKTENVTGIKVEIFVVLQEDNKKQVYRASLGKLLQFSREDKDSKIHKAGTSYFQFKCFELFAEVAE